MTDSPIGYGMYTFGEAARLTGLDRRAVRAAFGGAAPPLTSDFPAGEGPRAITFLNLIDLYVYGHLRAHGARPAAARAAYERLGGEFGTPYPFAHRDLATAGRAELVAATPGRRAVPAVIERFLKQLDYDADTGLARIWHIADGVELNPWISGGLPILTTSKKRTDNLANTFELNGRNVDHVAAWYGVTPDEVRTAVAFERGQAA